MQCEDEEDRAERRRGDEEDGEESGVLLGAHDVFRGTVIYKPCCPAAAATMKRKNKAGVSS